MEIFSFSATAEGHWKLIRMHSSRVLLPIKFHPLSTLSFKVELMCLGWLLGILHWNGGWALCQFPKRFPWLPQLFFGLLLEPLNLFHLKFFSALCLRLGRLGFGLTFPVVQQSLCLHMHTNTVETQTPWNFPKCSNYRGVPLFGTIKGDLNTEASSFQELIYTERACTKHGGILTSGLGIEEFHCTRQTCWFVGSINESITQPSNQSGIWVWGYPMGILYIAIYMTHTGM